VVEYFLVGCLLGLVLGMLYYFEGGFYLYGWDGV